MLVFCLYGLIALVLCGKPTECAQSKFAASHQDQVITPPAEAEVFLSSDFTPNAGLVYANGAAMSMQPHPEFEIGYAAGIVELLRDNPLNDHEVQLAKDSLNQPMDNDFVGDALGTFFLEAKKTTT